MKWGLTISVTNNGCVLTKKPAVTSYTQRRKGNSTNKAETSVLSSKIFSTSRVTFFFVCKPVITL